MKEQRLLLAGIAVVFIAMLSLAFAACQKDNEIFDKVGQIQHETRSETFDLSGVNLPGADFKITRTNDPNVWYVYNENGVYKGKKNKWKFVPVLSEVDNAVIQYEALHPDNLALPQPPSSAIHTWHFNTPMPCSIAKIGDSWDLQPACICPRCCDQ